MAISRPVRVSISRRIVTPYARSPRWAIARRTDCSNSPSASYLIEADLSYHVVHMNSHGRIAFHRGDEAVRRGSGNGLVLRTQIERGRADDGPVLSVFYLHESFGGLLDLVREIVADSITQNQAAGRDVQNAPRLLEAGDAASATSHFREAYDLYQTAYLRSTSQRPEKREK